MTVKELKSIFSKVDENAHVRLIYSDSCIGDGFEVIRCMEVKDYPENTTTVLLVYE